MEYVAIWVQSLNKKKDPLVKGSVGILTFITLLLQLQRCPNLLVFF